MARRRITVKEQRILSPDKKLYASKTFRWHLWKFGDTWENFDRWKRSFALEMASCWHVFLQDKKFFGRANRAIKKQATPMTLYNSILTKTWKHSFGVATYFLDRNLQVAMCLEKISGTLWLVCNWRHGRHVGSQKQKHFLSVRTWICFHENSSKKICVPEALLL